MSTVNSSTNNVAYNMLPSSKENLTSNILKNPFNIQVANANSLAQEDSIVLSPQAQKSLQASGSSGMFGQIGSNSGSGMVPGFQGTLDPKGSSFNGKATSQDLLNSSLMLTEQKSVLDFNFTPPLSNQKGQTSLEPLPKTKIEEKSSKNNASTESNGLENIKPKIDALANFSNITSKIPIFGNLFSPIRIAANALTLGDGNKWDNAVSVLNLTDAIKDKLANAIKDNEKGKVTANTVDDAAKGASKLSSKATKLATGAFKGAIKLLKGTPLGIPINLIDGANTALKEVDKKHGEIKTSDKVIIAGTGALGGAIGGGYGALFGIASGALTGAVAGSAVPVLGTVVGLVVGGIAGIYLSDVGAKAGGELAQNMLGYNNSNNIPANAATK